MGIGYGCKRRVIRIRTTHVSINGQCQKCAYIYYVVVCAVCALSLSRCRSLNVKVCPMFNGTTGMPHMLTMVLYFECEPMSTCSSQSAWTPPMWTILFTISWPRYICWLWFSCVCHTYIPSIRRVRADTLLWLRINAWSIAWTGRETAMPVVVTLYDGDTHYPLQTSRMHVEIVYRYAVHIYIVPYTRWRTATLFSLNVDCIAA